MPVAFRRLEIADVVLVEPRRFADERGWFAETFKASQFAAEGIPTVFAQHNASSSRHAGTVRGLHYQLPPHAQGKLVTCTRGAVLDVAVDLRPGSPTFCRHAAAELSAANGRSLWVPVGFAHGFMTLVDDTDVTYAVTAEYAPAHERALRWDDPALAIRWPALPARLSPKDAVAPTLDKADVPASW